MFRVTLTLDTGSHVRVIHLLSRQEVTVGRSYWADITIRDPKMADIHLRIVTSDVACYLYALESKTGTYVNGDSVNEVTLRDGDVLRAGISSIDVKIQGGSEDVQLVPERLDRCRSVDLFECATIPCASGLTCFKGPVPASGPGQLLENVAAKSALAIIADFPRAGVEIPGELQAKRYLLDWLPEPARDQSPLVVFPSDGLRSCNLVNQLWGSDALVAVITQPDLNEGTLLEGMRLIPGSLTHPSIVAPQLEKGSSDVLRTTLTDVIGIFVEDQAAESWQIFSTQKHIAELLHIGFSAEARDHTTAAAFQAT